MATAYSCSQCSYTTKRKYNYDRHINVKHNMSLQVASIKCPTCYKYFSNKAALLRHTSKCSHKESVTQCNKCRGIYGSTSALAHHKRSCSAAKKQEMLPNTPSQLLKCPLLRNQNYDFVREHITYKVINSIIDYTENPYIRFMQFIYKVFEHPNNQVIRKTNPKDTHSFIHVGDGKWEFVHDKDTLPVLTHHMTTAALCSIIDINAKAKIENDVTILMNVLRAFEIQVRKINEMDYDNQDYKDIIQRVKLAIVNFTHTLERKGTG